MERNTRKEMESLRDICFEIAKRTSTTFLNLGEAGKERVQSNRFGETTLRADWECEEEVLKILKKRGLNIRVISEEHGVVEIGGDEGKLLGILDGIDGTRQYVAEGSEYKSFGTLFGVFSNNDPLYKDCLASCAVEHSTGRIFMAFKGQGCFVIEQGKTRRIKLEGPKEVSSKLRMFGDGKSLYTAQLSPFNVIETSSATQNFLALLSGRGDVVSLYTLKGNLEPAVFYLMVKEAGGVMVRTDKGSDIGDEKYWEFGQGDHHIGYIAVASQELVKAILE